jgi:hypothetical protein
VSGQGPVSGRAVLCSGSLSSAQGKRCHIRIGDGVWCAGACALQDGTGAGQGLWQGSSGNWQVLQSVAGLGQGGVVVELLFRFCLAGGAGSGRVMQGAGAWQGLGECRVWLGQGQGGNGALSHRLRPLGQTVLHSQQVM